MNRMTRQDLTQTAMSITPNTDSSADPFAIDMTAAERVLHISDAAAKRLQKMIAQEGGKDMMLRITVSGGGCSGFQYGFTFDDKLTPDDLTFEKDGVRVVTDEVSMNLLAGSEVDFKDELVGAYFTVNNPNASSACGCGTSFAV